MKQLSRGTLGMLLSSEGKIEKLKGNIECRMGDASTRTEQLTTTMQNKAIAILMAGKLPNASINEDVIKKAFTNMATQLHQPQNALVNELARSARMVAHEGRSR